MLYICILVPFVIALLLTSKENEILIVMQTQGIGNCAEWRKHAYYQSLESIVCDIKKTKTSTQLIFNLQEIPKLSASVNTSFKSPDHCLEIFPTSVAPSADKS